VIEMRPQTSGPQRRAQRREFDRDAKRRDRRDGYRRATETDLAAAYAALAEPEPDWTFGGVLTADTAAWIADTFAEAAADYARAEAG
jgi:hypothetical protein